MNEYNLCVVILGVKLAVREPGGRNAARCSCHYKKKAGKWRSIQDLREVNGTMQPIGALQPVLSSSIAIPKDTCKTLLDLKDCFYTIPLAPPDCQRFAFSIPLVNFKEPMRRNQ